MHVECILYVCIAIYMQISLGFNIIKKNYYFKIYIPRFFSIIYIQILLYKIDGVKMLMVCLDQSGLEIVRVKF